jgi:FPC/CPF motif-containing protein YcgG
MGDPFQAEALTAFQTLVLQQEFPCVGARAALNAGSYVLNVYDELAGASATEKLSRDLTRFTHSELRDHEYATFVAGFAAPMIEDEVGFEQLLWRQLTLLNRNDAQPWDPSVRSDPSDSQFSFSFAGQALYVIGMHPQSSRLARRFRWPALVFNPHVQFERLRSEGKWKRMQQTIRERDVALQGSINPMLSDFGQSSEARQYSGRAVEEDWQPPFEPAKSGKCPFHH